MNENNELLKNASDLLCDLEPVLQKAIDSLQHDLTPHTGMIKNLIQDEIENYGALLERVQEAIHDVDTYLNPDDFTPPIIQQKLLCVTMPDGKQIRHPIGRATFVEVIETLGIDRVRRLGLTIGRYLLISPNDDYPHSKWKSGPYWIITNTSAEQKKRLLEKISEGLNASLKVEILQF